MLLALENSMAMKTLLLFVLLSCGSLPLRGEDDSFLPIALNAALPKIKAGMTVSEVEAVLKPAYPNVKAIGGEWSGETGCNAFRLDDRYTLCLHFVIRSDNQGRREVVAEKFGFDLADYLEKHRTDVSLYHWAKQQSEPTSPK
jgi:hypothetical protein